MDRKFIIYNHNGAYLGGKLENGTVTIISEIFDDDFNSELHVFLSKTETTKLFDILSLEEFIVYFKNKSLNKMLEFFSENKIEYSSFIVY